MVDEPTCELPNGSSISPRLCDQPHVVAEFCAPIAPARPRRPAHGCRILRGYVWPVTGRVRSNPHLFRHEPVDRLYLVGVIVAQAHEAGLRARGAPWRRESAASPVRAPGLRGQTSDLAATTPPRRPTVVSWAGWKCVYPSATTSRWAAANCARASMTLTRRTRISSNPARIWMRSVLSPTKALVAPQVNDAARLRTLARRRHGCAP